MKRLRFSPAAHVTCLLDCYLVFSERASIKIRKSRRSDALVSLLKCWVTEEQLHLMFGVNAVSAILEELRSAFLLEQEDTATDPPMQVCCKNIGFWSLFNSEPGRSQVVLSRRKVAILGMGSLGTNCLETLALVGITSFTIVDSDVVAEHNLNRQRLYGIQDVGAAKVEVAAREITRRLPHVSVNAKMLHMEGEESFLDSGIKDCDLIICCIDTPFRTAEINMARFAAKYGRAFLPLACGLTGGYWGPLVTPNTHSYDTVLKGSSAKGSTLEEAAQRAIGAPSTWSFCTTDSVIANLAMQDAVLYLSGVLEPALLNRRVNFNTFTYSLM